MSNSQKYLIISIPLIIMIIFAAIFMAPKNESAPLASTLDLNPSPSVTVVPTQEASEPIPFSWEEYSNDAFNFSLQYPSDWHKQEYKRNPQGGIFVAFSPDPLPCEDCSYINSAFFSVKVFSQKTEPEEYAKFLQSTKAVGKVAGYQSARLAGKPGFYHENTITVENNGWVYAVRLEKDLGTPGVDDSQIFRKVLNSFDFTYLIFNE